MNRAAHQVALLAALSLTTSPACTAYVSVQAEPENADIYITQYPLYNATSAPNTYIASGEGALMAPVPYTAFDQYWYYVEAPGYEAAAGPIPGELKVGPFIGGFFLFPFWLWAWGPSSWPNQVDLRPAQ